MDQSKKSQQKYRQMVNEVSPNSHLWRDCARAFVVGGVICLIGQGLFQWFTHMGATKELAATYMAVALIFAAILLTGLGVYDKIGKFAGGGTIVPITGFANAMAAPAVEFKREGYVLGVGAKMFIVAGPVIVYGILSSMLVGVVYYMWGRL